MESDQIDSGTCVQIKVWIEITQSKSNIPMRKYIKTNTYHQLNSMKNASTGKRSQRLTQYKRNVLSWQYQYSCNWTKHRQRIEALSIYIFLECISSTNKLCSYFSFIQQPKVENKLRNPSTFRGSGWASYIITVMSSSMGDNKSASISEQGPSLNNKLVSRLGFSSEIGSPKEGKTWVDSISTRNLKAPLLQRRLRPPRKGDVGVITTSTGR